MWSSQFHWQKPSTTTKQITARVGENHKKINSIIDTTRLTDALLKNLDISVHKISIIVTAMLQHNPAQLNSEINQILENRHKAPGSLNQVRLWNSEPAYEMPTRSSHQSSTHHRRPSTQTREHDQIYCDVTSTNAVLKFQKPRKDL